jgi:hypothetical protein
MVLETGAVATQWPSRDDVITPADTNATIILQQRNGVFFDVHAEVLITKTN